MKEEQTGPKSYKGSTVCPYVLKVFWEEQGVGLKNCLCLNHLKSTAPAGALRVQRSTAARAGACTRGLRCQQAWGSVRKVLLGKRRHGLSNTYLSRKDSCDGVGGRLYGPRKEGFHAYCSLWAAETPGPVGRHILSFISIPDGFWRSKVKLSAL